MSTFKLVVLSVLLCLIGTVGAAQAQSCTDAYEPNDLHTTAWGPLTSGGSYTGKICTTDDLDWFKVSIAQAGTLRFTLSVPAGRDYDLDLFGSDGSPLAFSYFGDPTESISYAASASGTYYLLVSGFYSFDITNSYTLTYTGPGGASSTGALRFIPQRPPCRIADTRNPAGPFGGPSIGAQSSRSFPIPQSACNVPSTATAYSLNVTAVPKTNFLGYITVWPSDQPQPWVSMLNSTDGRVKAGAAIVPAAATGGGAISVFATDPTDVVLDINGYFVDAASHPSALAFFTLPACRVVDTRYAGGSLGPPSMVAWNLRSFPILTSNCNIPTTAQAYSLNYTAVPKFGVPIGFLSTWPTTAPDAMPVPWVSTLNVPTGAVTANAAIVPAGDNGALSVLTTSGADVLIDINGYFAPSTSPSDLSFYTVPPCRVRDTRENTGLFSTTPIPIDTSASPCAILPSAQAIVVNATVVPTPPGLGFLTLWPNGQTQPNASTLNASDGFITANMAIVPTQSAVIKAYGSQPTQLVLDTTGYFASGTDPAPETYVLTVLHSGTGTGTVTSADGRMNCGAFCAVSYVSGSSVTLTASPTGGSSFAGWSGGGCSGTGSCICGLSTATSVTAAFNPPGPPPTVTGNWNFAASSTPYPMYSSSGSGTLQQNGTTVTGQFTLYGTPCGSYVTLNGTLTGTTFTFSVMEGSQLVNFSGTINASYTYASGTYQAPSGGCTAGDYGTWTATKQ